jgi:AAT family amino acid transporter
MMNLKDHFYLESRILENRVKQPIRGILGLAVSLIMFYAIWLVFMDPRGILRWYTPQYGYMYIRWILIVAIWQVYVFNYWPFNFKWREESHPVTRGIVLIAVNFAIVGIVIWGFFYNFIGTYSIPYLSVDKLVEKGMTVFFAREYSSLAILMFAAIASWLSPIIAVCFENHPWQNLKQPAKGLTIFMVSAAASMLAFFVLMHPHYHVLFYPWQEFAAAYPWWYNFAHTLHGNFNVGWVMCGTVAIWLLEVTFDRYPFALIKNKILRGVAGFFGVLIFALILFATFNFIQDISWGQAVEGAKRIYAPDWRYLHSGELAIMMLIPAMALNFYFDNGPKKYSEPVNIALRLIIIIAVTFVFHAVYYKVSPALLGTQTGYSHPQQFPMAPGILFICTMLFHNWFMDLWPGKKFIGTKEIILNEDSEEVEELPSRYFDKEAVEEVACVETKDSSDKAVDINKMTESKT